ncbi:putative membrane-bound dehydrogenase domain-containing protein [Rubritalea squalenifaciens DSM 18772]|uniref:Putative membrane-bound dehydrogenase domain-containing protein n=1 Tax=Rubritalea squalenifaciens DSM 18772 TaxID=1123071 RepID=A0A1M6PV22_9BACT|nr:PVC-type heme-binding CxxCH protein [Rubritalea squalenifaciens]SHK11781.1 putative membrane-bound dehydrogenase domain-containing protein [Rubritalea squalenifaciens DSM 18772]
MRIHHLLSLTTVLSAGFFTSCSKEGEAPASSTTPASPAIQPSISLDKNTRIVIEGNGVASRMMKFGHLETALHARFPEANLFIRNLADEGNTPGFRPNAGRKDQFSFPGAKDLVSPAYSSPTNSRWSKGPVGFYPTPDAWQDLLKPDLALCFFGSVSAEQGEADLDRFEKELTAYLQHLKTKNYGKDSPLRVILISPTAVEDLSGEINVPSGKVQNTNLALYTKYMARIAKEQEIPFVDLFSASKQWYKDSKDALTIDGRQLNDAGYQKLADHLTSTLFGKSQVKQPDMKALHAAVQEKNWVWHQDYKIPNGVHVYGQRYKPFGPDNYPHEIKKNREMAAIRDQAIWATAQGESFDVAAADAQTYQLPKIKSNFRPSGKNGNIEYKSGEETIKHLTLPEGYKIELFADEKMFPELANPVQISFDNKGRLWVACMPSYPHYKIGDPKPADTLLIFEDTDNDGKADKKTVFANDLHIPIGFELAPEGVYVSQSDSLVLLTDTDGDDKYDKKEFILSGFDDHDTHHAISAFCADPSGAIYMGEGVFLRSNVETAYGTVRGTNGGFMRYNPAKRQLERTAQINIPNPWGTAFDDYGQCFFLHTSDPSLNWLIPATTKPHYNRSDQAPPNLIPNAQKVRPTSGLEIISSRHFPDEVQGDILLNNTIGFLGTKQHQVEADGTGFKLTHRQDLLKSSEGNFRPVDLEFAPDGSLYLIDWSNTLIGHMQHNARDPYRDHAHGRVYRITYPSRPLVKPSKVAGATLEELFENLKLPEYRTRYRTRRELRGHDASEVLPALQKWVTSLNKQDPDYERHRLEALWVSWGLDQIDTSLLQELTQSSDYRVRAAAYHALRYNLDRFKNTKELLLAAAQDKHGQVRMEAITIASLLDKDTALEIIDIAKQQPVDNWLKTPLDRVYADLTNQVIAEKEDKELAAYKGEMLKIMKLGKEVYHRDAHCATCHQDDGKGLPQAGFPPLNGTKWVNEDPERLIKLTLKGLMGPINVKGKQWNGAMTPFGGMLEDDKEVAAVLTYVRKSFGNNASVITPEMVKKVREETKDRKQLYMADELLKEHPHKK